MQIFVIFIIFYNILLRCWYHHGSILKKKNRADEYVSYMRTCCESTRIHAGAFAEAEVLQDCNRALYMYQCYYDHV